MTLTNILLALIAGLLLARIVLQVCQGKETLKRAYATASELENTARITNQDLNEICVIMGMLQDDGWELVAAHPLKGGREILYFTRKKIKNYME